VQSEHLSEFLDRIITAHQPKRNPKLSARKCVSIVTVESPVDLELPPQHRTACTQPA